VKKIIRIFLTLLLIYGVYTETGIWTAISLFLIMIGIEFKGAFMNRILIISALLISSAFAQNDKNKAGWILYDNGFTTGIVLYPTKYDSRIEVDSVAYTGQYNSSKEICNTDTDSGTHYWIDEETVLPISIAMCAVNHDLRGWPDTWPRYWRICKLCLRKEHVHEVRTLLSKQKTEFELLDEKVSAILKGK
jgi:hypothetical protein